MTNIVTVKIEMSQKNFQITFLLSIFFFYHQNIVWLVCFLCRKTPLLLQPAIFKYEYLMILTLIIPPLPHINSSNIGRITAKILKCCQILWYQKPQNRYTLLQYYGLIDKRNIKNNNHPKSQWFVHQKSWIEIGFYL